MAKPQHSDKEAMSDIHAVRVRCSPGNRGDTNRWIGRLGQWGSRKGEKAGLEGKCWIARKFGTDATKEIYVNANYFSFPQE